MTPAAAAELLTLVSAYDSRPIDKVMSAAWAFGLEGCDWNDCVAAVHLYHRQSTEYAKPAHIRAIAVALANQRHEEADRQQRKALEAFPAQPTRIRQILEEFAEQRKIPADSPNPHPKQPSELQRRARAVGCPWCKAQAGQQCVNQGTQQPAKFVHEARLELAARPAEATG